MLKALTEVQRSFNKKGHLKQTSEQMKLVKEKYDIDSSDELSDDERDSQKLYPKDDDTQLSISELSESGMLGELWTLKCFLCLDRLYSISSQ